jgi:homoserine kinase
MIRDFAVVRAPASIANVGPGFDVFGLALREPFDLITVERKPSPGVQLRSVEGLGGKQVVLDPRRNTATVAAAKVLELAGADFGAIISIEKGVRPCSGMGSSGASAAGGAFAANLLLDSPLPMDRLVLCAALGEEAASGSLHADNVAPALLGGFTIIRSYDPLDVVRVRPPLNLGVVATLPNLMVPTKEARGALPKSVSLKDMVHQIGHSSALAVGMASGDLGLIGRSVRDVVIEPARERLVPHLREAESAALQAGALTSFLGGSGPCVAAFFDKDSTDGAGIAAGMRAVFSSHGVDSTSWVTTWGEGCREVSE